MSESKWKVGETYKLRNGQPAVILDLCDGRLFGRFFGQALCGWAALSWDAKTGEDGRSPGDRYDLMPPPAPRIRRDAWVNIYPDGSGNLSSSRDVADRISNSSRIACIRIAIDVPRGYGLDNDEPPIVVRAG